MVLSKENYITDITVTDKSESKTVTKQNFLNVSSFSSSAHFSLSPSFLWSGTTHTSTLSSSSFPSLPLNRPNSLPGSNLGTELWRNEWVLSTLNWSRSSKIHTRGILGLTQDNLDFSTLQKKVHLPTHSPLRYTANRDVPPRPLSLGHDGLLHISPPEIFLRVLSPLIHFPFFPTQNPDPCRPNWTSHTQPDFMLLYCSLEMRLSPITTLNLFS